MTQRSWRSRGWTVAAGLLGAATLLVAILLDQNDSLLFLLVLPLFFLGTAMVLFAALSLGLLVHYWRSDRIRAAYPLALCVLFAVAATSWPRLSQEFYDAVIFPARSGVFEQLQQDFQQTDGLTFFCYWGSDQDYRVNDEFVHPGEQPALPGVDVPRMARHMELIGVSCVQRLADGQTKLITWGWLDNECGFVHTPDKLKQFPAASADGTWYQPIQDGWYRFCT